MREFLLWFMKKIVLLSAVALFFVAGCSREDGGVQVGLVERTFTTFSIGIPGGWTKVEKEHWANTVPEETVAVFLFQQENGFIRNANVFKEQLNSTATSIEYAKANVLLGSKALFDYRRVSAEEEEIGGERTVVHEFEARNSSIDRSHRFTQAYFMKEGVGYTVTCIAEGAESDGVVECGSVVRSFRLR